MRYTNGMTEPARQDIQELVRRLETASYSAAEIREAGELLASALERGEAYRMALGFWDSEHGQVRALGLCMMRVLAPAHEGASGFVAGAKHAPAIAGSDPAAPDYSAIGEVIKHWMRQYRQSKGRR